MFFTFDVFFQLLCLRFLNIYKKGLKIIVITKSKTNLIALDIGIKIMPMIETPDKRPNKITPSNILGPYSANCCENLGLYLLIMVPKIWPPSNGYTGMRLKIAKNIFIWIKISRNVLTFLLFTSSGKILASKNMIKTPRKLKNKI